MTRRLSTKIASLERERPSTGMDAQCKGVLVSLLAKRDSYFWPWRSSTQDDQSWRVLPDVYKRQKEYLAGTIGLSVKADGKGSWKSAHELRQRLLASGFITANHSKGQITNVFLTLQGEATARALVGPRLKRFDHVKVVLDRLRMLCVTTDKDCISESKLFGKPLFGDASDWNDWTETILPLMTSGVVLSVPDTVGHIYYRLVPNAAEPVEPIVPKVDDDLDDLYLREYESERIRLTNLDPSDPNEIYIPMPAGGL